MQPQSRISFRWTVEDWLSGGLVDQRRSFQIEAYVSADPDPVDRAIQVRRFLRVCRSNFPEGMPIGQSCQTIATRLAARIDQAFPNRFVIVAVWLGEELGAAVLDCSES